MRTNIWLAALVVFPAIAACGADPDASPPSMTEDDAGMAGLTPDGGADATPMQGMSAADGGAAADGGMASTGTADAGAATMIGPAGGAFMSANGKVTLAFPPGAVSQPIEVRATPIAPAGAVPGAAYDLRPEGTLFQQPVTLTIAYDPAALPVGSDETGLRLVTMSPAGLALTMPDTVVDTVGHTVTGRIAHFSTWYVGPRPPARLDVEFLSQTQVRVNVTPAQGVIRAHVGHCPPGMTCPGSAQHFGCREEDFSLDPAVRPPESSVRCVYAGTPNVCAAPPGGTITDDVSAPGFYCYRAGTETVEVYSFGTLIAPPNPPIGFGANPNNPDGSVVLSWTPIQSNLGDISGYYLVRSASTGSKAVVINGAGVGRYVDADVVPNTVLTYALYAMNAAGYSATAAMATATSVMPTSGPSTPMPACRGLRLQLVPTGVSLFPGTAADVAVQIVRIDSGGPITLSLSLPAGSPLVGLIEYSVVGPNPTSGDGAVHVQQHLDAIDAQGTLRIHATDGFAASCDVDLSVHANI